MHTRRNSALSGLTLIEVSVIVAIILVICAIAIPGLLSSQRASNERNASTALKTLSGAEADFRANDRDWNHVNDFWTADVKGLYTMTSAEVRGAGTAAKDPAIKLIELEVAAADADGTFFPAGGENMPLGSFSSPSAHKGYWYAALLTDQTLSGTAEMNYKADTGGTPRMGPVHNTSKFGFVSFPDTDWAGKYVFRLNENNTIFRQATTGSPRKGRAVPPGLNSLPPGYLDWPDDSELKTYWSKID
jgi:type II secretory pathway pseudopilin PulG